MKILNHKMSIIGFFAVILAVALVFTSCSDGNTPEVETTTDGQTQPSQLIPMTDGSGAPITTMIVDEDGSTSPLYIMEEITGSGNSGNNPTQANNPTNSNNPTSAPTTTYTHVDPELQAIANIVNIINSGNYHFVGELPSEDGEPSLMDLTIFGTSIKMITDFSGTKVDIRIINNTMYMLNNDKKKYCEVSSAALKQMGMDADALDFSDITDTLSGDKAQLTGEPAISSVTINGKALKKYEYQRASGGKKSFFIDSQYKLVRMETIDEEGAVTTSDFSTFEGGITADDINIPSDYDKQMFATFLFGLLGDFMSE